jgi:hypothetical protein
MCWKGRDLAGHAIVKEITMESFAFSITVVAAALLLVVIIQLIRGRLAEMEDAGEMGSKQAAPKATDLTDSGDTSSYGPIDCFGDCMRAFRWQPREEVECAKSCGLNPR